MNKKALNQLRREVYEDFIMCCIETLEEVHGEIAEERQFDPAIVEEFYDEFCIDLQKLKKEAK